MSMKKVGEIVRDRPLLFVHEGISVHAAAQFMSDKKIGAVPVLDGERLVGVFSERDLMTRVVVPGRDPHSTFVRDVMTRDLVVASPTDDTEDCEAKMAERGCRHLPVVQADRLLGFLSLRDLLRSDLDDKSEELAIMTYYAQSVPPDVEQRIPHEPLH
jgi:CBS domain-containing protein